MSEAVSRQQRLVRVILACLVLGVFVPALVTDLPEAARRRFWSDGATYYSMAWSIARDGDLRFDRDDLERVRREFPGGPDGVFLKRSSGGLTLDAGFPWLRRLGPDEGQIYFAKAFAYPLAAAPFVGLFGTRGLLLLNALCLAASLLMAYSEARRRASPVRAAALAVGVLLCGVTPIYLVWPQPELFNLALVCGGLCAWRRDRPLLSAALFGIATYSKPTNLLVALPLGVAPFLTGARPWPWLGLRESLRRGLTLAAAAGALYLANAAVTGEWNYQGGERKTFYGRFPGDTPQVTFENSGIWMTTEQLGPATPEAGAEARARERGVIERPPSELRVAFLRNLGYFWVGRFAGVVPYFFPVALGAALFLLLGPRDRDGWLALAAVAVSGLAYITLIPDNWYGGGGTVGNRYFLNLVPLALFFVPRGRELQLAVAGAAATAILLGPALLSPVAHSLEPWHHALRAPLRLFPLELTMLNDLGFCSDPPRKKRPFGDPEGRAGRADPRAYWLYFPDDGTYLREVVGEREGFWLRRGARAEIVLRALVPVLRIVVRADGGPAGDIVTARAGGASLTKALQPRQVEALSLPAGQAFPFYLSYLYTLRLESSGAELRGLAPKQDARELGAFVSLELELDEGAR